MLGREDQHLLHTLLPFWSQLSTQQANLLLSRTQLICYSHGQLLHHSREDCIGILILKHGRLRTYLTSPEGREITLFRLHKHEVCILSASCLLTHINFDVSIMAEANSQALCISAAAFSQLAAENIYAQLFSYQLTTDRFSDVMWTMQQILFTSFDKRLAAFLLTEIEESHCLDIQMTHEQIARYLGSAREVVSRMLKYFANEGYLRLFRGGLTILDSSALQALIE